MENVLIVTLKGHSVIDGENYWDSVVMNFVNQEYEYHCGRYKNPYNMVEITKLMIDTVDELNEFNGTTYRISDFRVNIKGFK